MDRIVNLLLLDLDSSFLALGLGLGLGLGPGLGGGFVLPVTAPHFRFDLVKGASVPLIDPRNGSEQYEV